MNISVSDGKIVYRPVIELRHLGYQYRSVRSTFQNLDDFLSEPFDLGTMCQGQNTI